MGAVLLRAASLAFIIGIGIFLNERRMVAADAGDVIKKIMIHITLPAAIIANFCGDSFHSALAGCCGRSGHSGGYRYDGIGSHF